MISTVSILEIALNSDIVLNMALRLPTLPGSEGRYRYSVMITNGRRFTQLPASGDVMVIEDSSPCPADVETLTVTV